MLISLLLVGVLGGSPARLPCTVCQCITAEHYGQTPVQFVHARRDRAERVAMGTVIRLDTLARVEWGSGHDAVAVRPIVARLKVSKVWRGAVTDTMTVMFRTVELRNSCELELKPGQTYLIFARRNGGGPLATYQCSGTEELVEASHALAALGPGTVVPR